MSLSIIDGTLETANVKRGSVSPYDSIVIRRTDGGEARLRKIMVADSVAHEMQLGIRGRFYLYSAIDQDGLHGLRTADGVAIHEFPDDGERVFLILSIVSLVFLIGHFALKGTVTLQTVGFAVVTGIAYLYYRTIRIKSRRQFDADGGYSAA